MRKTKGEKLQTPNKYLCTYHQTRILILWCKASKTYHRYLAGNFYILNQTPYWRSPSFQIYFLSSYLPPQVKTCEVCTYIFGFYNLRFDLNVLGNPENKTRLVPGIRFCDLFSSSEQSFHIDKVITIQQRQKLQWQNVMGLNFNPENLIERVIQLIIFFIINSHVFLSYWLTIQNIKEAYKQFIAHNHIGGSSPRVKQI